MRTTSIALAAAAALTLTLAAPRVAHAASTTLVISQVYGGGGNASANWRNDFIEIFNLGSTPVSVGGWSVQYAAAGGTTWTVTNLTNVTIQPGKYYLVQEASGGAVGTL